MAQKTIGFVELEWICPNCNMKNPGTKKVCSGCGSPQPENVAFQRAQDEKLLEKEAVSAEVLQADIHCGFCGTRNPANAVTCSQCNADLSAGKQRASGQVVGAFQPGKVEEVQCPHCASMNPANHQFCSKCGGSLAQIAPPKSAQPVGRRKLSLLWFILLGLAALVGCGLLFALLGGLLKSDSISATVDQRSWQRTIAIEQFIPVEKEAWKDELPLNAEIISCKKRFHHTQDEPAPDSEEICGTPYVKDKGSGLGEVVQDCKYQVKMDYCQYTTIEWAVVDSVSLEGSEPPAAWPQFNFTEDQRAGETMEKYTIVFVSGSNTYRYTTSDNSVFEQALPGSVWKLQVNTFNSIIAAEPQ